MAQLMRDRLRVAAGDSDLASRATSDRFDMTKADSESTLAALTSRLSVLQNRLWAEHERAVLLVLQGLDAAGKDGVIRRVFTGLNPQGCRVISFKEPSHHELDHDYLWRIHRATPPRGEIGIFNRSHYEDVVTTVILGLIDETQRKHRYEQINAFERMLSQEGTTSVKVFLNVGKEEQRQRLQARLDDPEKRWKFKTSDLETRTLFDEYVRRYGQAMAKTSTDTAPWYVVPADHKWVSAIAVATLLVETLEEMDPQIPAPAADLEGITIV